MKSEVEKTRSGRQVILGGAATYKVILDPPSTCRTTLRDDYWRISETSRHSPVDILIPNLLPILLYQGLWSGPEEMFSE